MKILIYLSFLIPLVASETFTLNFSDEITWKSIFDDGFHPYHHGDGHSTCIQRDISLDFNFKGENLELHEGDLFFTLLKDREFRGVILYGKKNLSERESDLIVTRFKKIFFSNNLKEPEKNNYSAEAYPFVFTLSVENSYNLKKPDLIRFGVYNVNTTAPLYSKNSQKITAPQGYEHMSLAPKIVNKEYYDEAERRIAFSKMPEGIKQIKLQDDLRQRQKKMAFWAGIKFITLNWIQKYWIFVFFFILSLVGFFKFRTTRKRS